MSGSHFSSEQRLEIVRSVQFASIFCFYTCFWVYEILLSYAGYFHIDFHFNCLPVFFLWIEATMNAVINATNKEVKTDFTTDSTQINNHLFLRIKIFLE